MATVEPRDLMLMGQVERALAEASTVDEIKSIIDKAEAARMYAKKAQLGLESQNKCAAIKLLAERMAGKMLKEMADSGERAKSGKESHLATLSTMGINNDQSSRWQKEATVPDEAFEEFIEDCHKSGKEVTQAGLLKLAGAAHVSQNSGDNEWYTPAPYIEAARKAMGGIDLDPASNDAAQEQVQAGEYFTIADDGLSQEWSGRVWMNPPYAKDVCGKFTAKLIEHFKAGDIAQACVLVNNATETAFFQDMAACASVLCFPRGRVKFWAPDKSTCAPLQGQAVLYFGNRRKSFLKHFAGFGFCMEASGEQRTDSK